MFTFADFCQNRVVNRESDRLKVLLPQIGIDPEQFLDHFFNHPELLRKSPEQILSEWGGLASTLKGAGTGAATGAALGSFVAPGIGTAIGGLGGAAIGGLAGAFGRQAKGAMGAAWQFQKLKQFWPHIQKLSATPQGMEKLKSFGITDEDVASAQEIMKNPSAWQAAGRGAAAADQQHSMEKFARMFGRSATPPTAPTDPNDPTAPTAPTAPTGKTSTRRQIFDRLDQHGQQIDALSKTIQSLGTMIQSLQPKTTP